MQIHIDIVIVIKILLCCLIIYQVSLQRIHELNAKDSKKTERLTERIRTICECRQLTIPVANQSIKAESEQYFRDIDCRALIKIHCCQVYKEVEEMSEYRLRALLEDRGFVSQLRSSENYNNQHFLNGNNNNSVNAAFNVQKSEGSSSSNYQLDSNCQYSSLKQNYVYGTEAGLYGTDKVADNKTFSPETPQQLQVETKSGAENGFGNGIGYSSVQQNNAVLHDNIWDNWECMDLDEFLDETGLAADFNDVIAKPAPAISSSPVLSSRSSPNLHMSPHHLTASLNSPPASGLMSPAQAVQSPISFGVPSPLASLGRAVNPLTYASPSETSGATSPGRTFSVRTSPGRASPASSHCGSDTYGGSDIYGDSISAAEDNKTEGAPASSAPRMVKKRKYSEDGEGLTETSVLVVPGQEGFDPAAAKFAPEDLQPQPIIKKSKKQFVLDENKDEKYWKRRNKNNVAAKRSREARRAKENQIILRASFLENEVVRLTQLSEDKDSEIQRLTALVKQLQKERNS
ncbi:Pdp1 [Bugula neritina]|uniref:Pdp1 n=1 Tax=Bugula neritina TaxID=10212 RepID=A0A7J7JFD5_BUGNE|nr:Pdp1 [Bugula neritina]